MTLSHGDFFFTQLKKSAGAVFLGKAFKSSRVFLYLCRVS